MVSLNIIDFDIDPNIVSNSQCNPLTDSSNLYKTFSITDCTTLDCTTINCTTVNCTTINCTNVQCSLCTNDSGNCACDCAYDTYEDKDQ